MEPAAFVFCLAVFVYLIVRLLHLASQPETPELFYSDSPFIQSVLQKCPLLVKTYFPPLLWGKSGHLQTAVYAKLGRIKSPFPKGVRKHDIMEDGATMTFDIFEPHQDHPTGGDYTMLVCPGIANSSESVYIRTFVDHAQNCGYRVAVLNHLGALPNVKLTAPRIFTYGGTDEYHRMVDHIRKDYPESHLLAVGFSMGANIVTKYLGEDKKNQEGFICGISLCQGYDVVRCEKTWDSWQHLMRFYSFMMTQKQKQILSQHKEILFKVEKLHNLDLKSLYSSTKLQHIDEFYGRCLPLLLSWEHMRRFYIFAMTTHQKSLLNQHSTVLFGEDSSKKYGSFDLTKVYASTSLHELDENYSRRRAGFSTLQEYYEWCSCSQHIHNIEVPMFILNAADDPLVPHDVYDVPKNFVKQRPNSLFAVTKHGGHLGFFEGGPWMPHPVTWLDRIIVQYSDAIVATLPTKTNSAKE